MQDETTYMLEPTAFHSMREAQDLTDQLEESLSKLSNVAANIKPQVVEMFSEMVNNAAEHGMSDAGAHCHVRLMPHRRSLALDSVITDRGPGIRATLERNPNLQVESDEQALRLAVQELTSGTGNPTSVLYSKFAGKSGRRWPGFGRRSWSRQKVWGLRW